MRSKLSVSFYLHRKWKDDKNQVPIIIRIKLHGLKRDISSGLRIDPDQWNSKFGAVKGSGETAKQINQLLTVSKNRLFQTFTKLSYGGEVSIDDLVDEYHGKEKPKDTKYSNWFRNTTCTSKNELRSTIPILLLRSTGLWKYGLPNM